MITNFKNIDNINLLSNDNKNIFRGEGCELLMNNKIGIIILAGGQGSRLGLNKPKGTLKLNGKSLFQIHAEKINNLIKEYGIKETVVKIPLYIMTSCNTHQDTINFFEENNYFNLNKEDVIFFQQDNNYCFDSIGGNKIIKEYKNNKPIYTTCPNGNGGIYKAIHSKKIYDDFLKRKLKYIFIQNVDNPIVKLCDTLMLGYTQYNNLDVCCKVSSKKDQNEKVGIFCYKNNKPSIVEYYELEDKLKNLRNKDNELVYNQANISIYLLSVDFIKSTKNLDLELHYAKKKIQYWDEKLKKSIKPEVENGYKPEYFIFDVFKYCSKKKMRLLTIDRESEFCPIKNKSDISIAEKKLL